MKLLEASLVSLAMLFATTEYIVFGQDYSAANPLDSFAGTWKMPAVISAGKVKKFAQEAVFERDRVVFKRRGETDGETWSFTVDTTTSPKQITMTRIAGIPDLETGKPQKLNAIFVQTEKEIRIAILPGRNGSSLEERPKDMSSTETNLAIVFVLTRE